MYAVRAFLLSAILLVPYTLHAATLTFGAGSAAIGSTISIPVIVSTNGSESLNAVSANISFPEDKLSLVSISKSPSIITLWAQEPVYSNTNGTASLEGIVPNPGFSGTGGRVATLVFSVKAAGSAVLSFTSASVLANDGMGTNILASAPAQTLTLGGAAAKTTTVASSPAPASAFPISSLTHPDESAWYDSTSGTFVWTVPPGASATRLLLSASQSATPSVVYTPAISTKTIENIPDGVSYLLVQHQVDGVWGGVGRYRIQVDTDQPRAFNIVFPHGTSDINPQPVILFNTFDDGSGIDHYEVKIGASGPLRTASAADSNPYALPIQEPGAHTVVVTAYDKAGNTTTQTAEFFIEGIDAPEFTDVPETVAVGDLIRLQGVTYENAEVTVSVYEKEEIVSEEYVQSNSLGHFGIIITKRLTPGTYAITARVTDSRGARSTESVPVTVKVESRFLIDLTDLVIDYLSAGLLIILSVAALIALGLYAGYRLLNLRRSLAVRRLAAEHALHQSFHILKQDIRDHVRHLEHEKTNRALTKEEIDFLEEFGNELKEAEQIVGKEIKRIPKL